MLLLGDHRAFFTMYRAITDAGMRAYQLDRDGALVKGSLEVCYDMGLQPHLDHLATVSFTQ